MSFVEKDLSYWIDGDVSIAHVLNRIRAGKLVGPAREMKSVTMQMRRRGITHIKNIGSWVFVGDAVIFEASEDMTVNHLTLANRRAKIKLVKWLTETSLVNVIPGGIHLCRPPEHRIKNLEETIIRSATVPDEEGGWMNEDREEIWATDGSVRPADALAGEMRSVTSVVTGPLSLSNREQSRTNSIGHGEVRAIAMAQHWLW